MILTHHDLKIELNDAWWTEAGMTNFIPAQRAFRVDRTAAKGEPVFENQPGRSGPF